MCLKTMFYWATSSLCVECRRAGKKPVKTKVQTLIESNKEQRGEGMAALKIATPVNGAPDKVECTRLIKIILKALLIILFPLCRSFCPSPGPGCFRAQRTDTQQKVISNIKYRNKAAITKKSNAVLMMDKTNTISQDTQPQASLYLSGLYLRKVTGWMVSRCCSMQR